MLIDRPHVLLKQFRQLLLRQPNRLVFQFDFKACAPVLGLVEDDFRSRSWILLAHGKCFKPIKAAGQQNCWNGGRQNAFQPRSNLKQKHMRFRFIMAGLFGLQGVVKIWWGYKMAIGRRTGPNIP